MRIFLGGGDLGSLGTIGWRDCRVMLFLTFCSNGSKGFDVKNIIGFGVKK